MSIAPELIAMLPRLRRFAMTLCGSAATADDLVQAACEKAWANQDSWTPGTRFDAWMFRILRNKWIDGLRRQKTEGHVEPIEKRGDLIGDHGEARAMDKLTLEDVRRAVNLLPPEQKEVLLLICVEELAYGEAADVLGVPLGTVMSRLSRARKRLNEMTQAA
jgi:RNA polymerase sigma-70 factor (ECF subfamily)